MEKMTAQIEPNFGFLFLRLQHIIALSVDGIIIITIVTLVAEEIFFKKL